MDWQKNLLIAAMVAVLFMLAIRWNDFQENLPTTPVPSSATTGISSELPLPGTSDIPSAPDAEQSAPITPGTHPASAEKIRVVTDSLEMIIDPHGGDVLHVALPRHYAHLNNPDEPFVLLDDNEVNTYVIQSGLVGTNGTDTSQGRPIFSAEHNEYRLAEGSDQLVVDLHLQQGEVDITKRF